MTTEISQTAVQSNEPASSVDVAPEASTTPEVATAPEAAPVEYTLDIKPPEGFERLDEAAMETFKTIATDVKLPSETAQKLVNLYADQMRAQMQAHIEQSNAWKTETESDTVIGGAKLKDSLVKANAALEKFAPKELRQLLDSSGLANNVHMVKMLAQVGATIMQDGVVTGNSSVTPRDFASILYPNQK